MFAVNLLVGVKTKKIPGNMAPITKLAIVEKERAVAYLLELNL
jgi:hypothetical protein